MDILAIIPARYGSTRFPGKPLIEIEGQPMVWQTYLRAKEAGLEEVVVATDDRRIEQAVMERGGRVLMTSSLHLSGTDRCAEALALLEAEGKTYDFVLNIQGDEPFLQAQQIQALCRGLEKGTICTLAKRIEMAEQLQNPNTVKLVWSSITHRALYFSRYPIPYSRAEAGDILQQHHYYKHIGLYGFDAQLLPILAALPPSSLELAESLEQLRWLENGFPIAVVETIYEAQAIDSPEDLAKLKRND